MYSAVRFAFSFPSFHCPRHSLSIPAQIPNPNPPCINHNTTLPTSTPKVSIENRISFSSILYILQCKLLARECTSITEAIWGGQANHFHIKEFELSFVSLIVTLGNIITRIGSNRITLNDDVPCKGSPKRPCSR